MSDTQVNPEQAEAAVLANLYRKSKNDQEASTLKIEALQGLDLNLRYIFYVSAAEDGGQLTPTLSFMERLRSLQKALASMGIQAVLIPVTGSNEDIKLRAIEIEHVAADPTNT